jgi:hypothetical protein
MRITSAAWSTRNDSKPYPRRQGDLEGATRQGERALNGQRKSLPSLLMVSRDLTRVLNDRYPTEAGTREYLDHLHVLSEGPERPK